MTVSAYVSVLRIPCWKSDMDEKEREREKERDDSM